MPDEAPDSYDVLILGGGSGGYACALRSAQLGLRVALIERDKLEMFKSNYDPRPGRKPIRRLL